MTPPGDDRVEDAAVTVETDDTKKQRKTPPKELPSLDNFDALLPEQAEVFGYYYGYK